MTYKELKEGEIYFVDWYNNGEHTYIMKHGKGESVGYIFFREKSFHTVGNFNGNGVVFTEATEEQKEHYTQCEKAGIYKDYVKTSIPEYLIFN